MRFIFSLDPQSYAQKFIRYPDLSGLVLRREGDPLPVPLIAELVN